MGVCHLQELAEASFISLCEREKDFIAWGILVEGLRTACIHATLGMQESRQVSLIPPPLLACSMSTACPSEICGKNSIHLLLMKTANHMPHLGQSM